MINVICFLAGLIVGVVGGVIFVFWWIFKDWGKHA
jgi:hypothetical protein